MHTVTDQDLQDAPRRLLADAQRGEVTVVTVDNRPVMMALPLDDGVPLHTALVDLAAHLYDRDLISLERAARIAGLSYSEMIDALGQRGVATIRTTPEELECELAAFGP